jgi:hypothetical protein
MNNKKKVVRDIAYENFNYACLTIRQHPILAPLFAHANVIRSESNLCPKNGWGVVTSNGNIHVHPTRRGEPSVAAVDAQSKEIFINPAAGLDEYESRFVMAHELLHVGLSHQARRQGRNPYLWNVACDYLINSWLVEMGLESCRRWVCCMTWNSKASQLRLFTIASSLICADIANWRRCGVLGYANSTRTRFLNPRR